MSVNELTRNQLIQLKQFYFCQKHDHVSWGEFANIDNLVDDEEVFNEYSDTLFVEDDFF